MSRYILFTFTADSTYHSCIVDTAPGANACTYKLILKNGLVFAPKGLECVEFEVANAQDLFDHISQFDLQLSSDPFDDDAFNESIQSSLSEQIDRNTSRLGDVESQVSTMSAGIQSIESGVNGLAQDMQVMLQLKNQIDDLIETLDQSTIRFQNLWDEATRQAAAASSASLSLDGSLQGVTQSIEALRDVSDDFNAIRHEFEALSSYSSDVKQLLSESASQVLTIQMVIKKFESSLDSIIASFNEANTINNEKIERVLDTSKLTNFASAMQVISQMDRRGPNLPTCETVKDIL